MSLTAKQRELLVHLAEKPSYVRDATAALNLSTRTTVSALEKLELEGLVESFEESEGVGRPRKYYALTEQGYSLVSLLNMMKFRGVLNRLRRVGYRVSAGVRCSVSYYGAPLVMVKFDVGVEKAGYSKASELAGKCFRVEVLPDELLSKVFLKNGVPLMVVEELVVAVLLDGEPRLVLSVPLMLKGRSVDFDRVLRLSRGFKVFEECSAVLWMTHNLTGTVPERVRTLCTTKEHPTISADEFREFYRMWK